MDTSVIVFSRSIKKTQTGSGQSFCLHTKLPACPECTSEMTLLIPKAKSSPVPPPPPFHDYLLTRSADLYFGILGVVLYGLEVALRSPCEITVHQLPASCIVVPRIGVVDVVRRIPKKSRLFVGGAPWT